MASDSPLSMPSSPFSTYTAPSRTSTRGRLGYRFLFTLLSLHSLHSSSFYSSSKSSIFFAEALVSCTYPNYLTEVKPGETSLLTWQVSGQDLTTYDKLTATLYCMDLNGNQGGMWRGIETLFQNRGLAAQSQIKFSVPDCGRLANNVAIRIVASGQQGSAVQNDACYFKMDPKMAVVPPVTTTTTTTSQSPPVITTTKDPNPPVTQPTATNKPDPTVLPPSSPGTTNTVPPTGPTTIISTNPPSSFPTTVTTISGTVVTIPYPSTKPYPPLPPLPPLSDPPPPPSLGNVGGGGGGGSGNDQPKTLLASICSGAALVIIVSLLVLRRRRSMRNGNNGRGINSNRGLKLSHLKLLRGRSKGDQKEGHFHLMRDDDDYDSPEMDREVALAAATTKTTMKSLTPTPPPSQAPPPMPLLIDISPESAEKIDQHTASYRDSSLSYPPNAHLDPSWRRSASFPYTTYSDDDYTMSSMRSSCETSSVVREYWAASMAARTERRLEGYPPTIDLYDEGSVFGDHHRRTPSFSSVSRKAEIMTLDSASIAESNVLPAADGILKRHYRNTMNSVQSYLQRSMTMSLTSLHSTFTSSSEEENSSAGYRTRSRGNGFRPPIDSEFLNHLNIKSLQSEERQLEYYTHLYRQNPTMTMSTANYDNDCESQAARSSILTGASRRTSSVPSLTSTNDPFKTFDSNEILLDMSPFGDQHAILPTSPNMFPSTSPSPRVRPVSSSSSSTERNPATMRGGGSQESTPTNSHALTVVNISSARPLENAKAEPSSSRQPQTPHVDQRPPTSQLTGSHRRCVA
ncbi:hypothetical protein BGZ95_007065 [Linnemannia exigua]|uniref:Uncharacterized protein n=1 Tax=Linnemannia exigua TaxID=604196 RepID=A0AAD4DH82_9FUNG|nr:hypothetical protein BGZ95_007065 [Linnemannia exigua]